MQALTFSIILIQCVILCLMHHAYGICWTGWDSLNGQKCYKVFNDTMLTYDDAAKFCSKQYENSTLAIIHSQTEQDFITDMLYSKQKIVDGVWIGAKFDKDVAYYRWIDGTEFNYNNWAQVKPLEIPYECVQLESEQATQLGKWTDEPCMKKNLALCQYIEPWSIEQLNQYVKAIVEQTNENTKQLKMYKHEIYKNKKLLDTTTAQLNELKIALPNEIMNKSIPVGFIYVQLPGQKDPKIIWPLLTWTDVTTKYAGAFFRAEGGGSNVFNGCAQDGASPRLTDIKAHRGWDTESMSVSPGSWTKWIYTGTTYFAKQNNEWALSFLVSNTEVRPMNYAIRIWQRQN